MILSRTRTPTLTLTAQDLRRKGRAGPRAAHGGAVRDARGKVFAQPHVPGRCVSSNCVLYVEFVQTNPNLTPHRKLTNESSNKMCAPRGSGLYAPRYSGLSVLRARSRGAAPMSPIMRIELCGASLRLGCVHACAPPASRLTAPRALRPSLPSPTRTHPPYCFRSSSRSRSRSSSRSSSVESRRAYSIISMGVAGGSWPAY